MDTADYQGWHGDDGALLIAHSDVDLICADDILDSLDEHSNLSVAETLLQVSLCRPGSEAISWLESLDGRPLNQAEALQVAGEWERQARWLTSRQQDALVAFAGPKALEQSIDDHRRESSNVLELALTIDCSINFTKVRLAHARLLATTLTATRDRLATGELSDYRVRRICEELSVLDPATAREIEAKLLPTAADVQVPALVRRLRRLVLAARGPEAAAAHRHGAAARRVVVETEAGEPGLLGLHVYLPPEQTIAIREALQAKAAEFAKADRAARDDARRNNRGRRLDHRVELPQRRTKDQRLADAAAWFVLGPDEADPARPAKPPVLVQVTIDLPTLLHLRDNPGELGGYGPIPIEIARELAVDADWQRFVHEPVTGHLLDLGDDIYVPNRSLDRFRKARDVTCRFPGSRRSARFADGDHLRPFRQGGGGGRTSARNIASLAKIGHIAKTHNGWRVSGDANGELTWTSPHGATYATTPHDYRADDGPPPF